MRTLRNVRFILVSTVVFALACSSTSAGPGDAGAPPQDTGSAFPDTGAPPQDAAAGDALPMTCPQITTGPGTMHNSTLAQPETWTMAGSPYVIPYDMSVTAALTIEACTTVLIAAGRTITVSAGGSIVAQGANGFQQVSILAKDTANWATIRAMGGGTLSFSYTTIQGGGDPLNGSPDYTGMLEVSADATKPLAEVLHAVNLMLVNSMGQGVYMHDGAGFSATSRTLTIDGSKGYPIHASANLAGTIPDLPVLNGNGVQEILLSAGDTGQTVASADVRLKDPGVPYHVGSSSAQGRFDVGGKPGASATLTIDPGVKLRFKKGGALYVDYFHGSSPAQGTLIAAGTSQKPITFTSAEPTPAAGDWLGLNFGDLPSGNDKLDFVHVEYAGGASGSGSSSCPYPGVTINDAAIRFSGAPVTAFITNTTILDSASNGIDRGWASNSQPDFLVAGNNTFTNFPGCTQTYPKDANNGGCPSPVPCPK